MSAWLEKADRYLVSAQLLLGVGETESAVSRAYYAACYAAIHLYQARNIPWRKEWLHNTMQARIGEQAHRLGWLGQVRMHHLETFGQSWKELLEQRSLADYDADQIAERVARRNVAFAQAVVRAIRESVP